MKSRWIFLIVLWTIASSCIGWASLMFLLALNVKMMGGPAEPPHGMSAEEFFRWRESGQWWRDDVTLCLELTVISLLIATVATVIVVLWNKRARINEHDA
jgi:hypothetical protein